MANVKTKKPIQEESTCSVPRNFILLDSIDRAGQFSNVTYGIVPDDEGVNKNNSVKLENWTGTIMYDDGKELYIIEMKIRVPHEFPLVPPVITFAPHCLEIEKVKKISNDDGTINNKYFSQIEWDPKRMGIGEYLMQIHNKIRNR